MKHLFYILSLACLLMGCQQEELSPDKAMGYLALKQLTTLQANEQLLQTKSIDSDLILCISGTTTNLRYEAGQVPASLSLPVGDYTLEAFNEYYEGGTNGAIFYIKESVSITAETQTEVELKVPMLNSGIQFSLSELPFSNYEFQATPEGGTTVTLTTPDDIAYFPTDANGKALSYQFSATNEANEKFTLEGTQTVTLAARTLYTVTYDLETKTIEINP